MKSFGGWLQKFHKSIHFASEFYSPLVHFSTFQFQLVVAVFLGRYGNQFMFLEFPAV